MSTVLTSSASYSINSTSVHEATNKNLKSPTRASWSHDGTKQNAISRKFKIRRHKANARERNRMHGLNAALDALRKCIPVYSQSQKLSKIETLRLAKNYIEGMVEILRRNEPIEPTGFTRILSKGLSEGTANAIGSFLATSHQNSSMERLKPYRYSVVEPNGLLKDFVAQFSEESFSNQ